MESMHSDRASGFQILASTLPKMVKAVSSLGSVDKTKKLGDITSRVAGHLRAEICSIFLLDRYKKLLLEEAYGYDEDAIGTEKSLDEGLTARILKDKLEIVANFDVQDRGGWKGQLDKDLKGHCWCLLGVPIIGANNVVRGVIKVENRRRQIADQNTPKDTDNKPSISDTCTFLGAMADVKNTPNAIREIIGDLADKTLKVLDLHSKCSNSLSDPIFKLRKLVEQTSLLADGLAKCKVSAEVSPTPHPSDNIPHQKVSDDDINNLESSTLEQRIISLRWYTEALTASVMRIMSSPPIRSDGELPLSQEQVDILKACREAVALLQSLKLALDAYEPFGQEDLFLMRAVAAMIAAALDIREAAGREVLYTLRHALKSDASLLLQNVHKVSQGDFSAMPSLFRTALYISGQQGVFKAFEKDTRETITFEDLYKNTLLSRLRYYYDYLRTAKKQFKFPEGISDDLKQKKLFDTDAIIAALDIIIVNVEKHSKEAENVRLDIRREGNSCLLIVSDDGHGFKSEKLSEIREIWESVSSEEGFPEAPRGLLAAKWALKRDDMELEIGNGLKDCLGGAYAKIIISI